MRVVYYLLSVCLFLFLERVKALGILVMREIHISSGSDSECTLRQSLRCETQLAQSIAAHHIIRLALARHEGSETNIYTREQHKQNNKS